LLKSRRAAVIDVECRDAVVDKLLRRRVVDKLKSCSTVVRYATIVVGEFRLVAGTRTALRNAWGVASDVFF